MFSVNHFIWLGICLILVVVGLYLLRKYNVPLSTVLTIACVVCVLSELVKLFSSMEMVESANGKKVYPYIELQHLPFHLCSMQILFIFYAKLASPSTKRTAVLAFMYPTCIVGAIFALLMPSLFRNGIPPEQVFVHPKAYQYFLFHSMLIILGFYILLSGEVDIRPKHYFTSMGILGAVSVISIYLNALCSSPVYENGKLVSVDYIPNFFFLLRVPINGIKLTEMWHWYLYLGILGVLAVSLVALFYVPVFVKAKKAKKAE